MTKNSTHHTLEFPLSDFARLFEAQVGETYLVQDLLQNEQGVIIAKPGDNVTLTEIVGYGPIGYQVTLETEAADKATVPFESSHLMGWYPGLPVSISLNDREKLVELLPSFAIFTKQGELCDAVQSGTVHSAYSMMLELGIGGSTILNERENYQTASLNKDEIDQIAILKRLFNNTTIVEISNDQFWAVQNWNREGRIGKLPIPTPPEIAQPKEHSALRIPEDQESIKMASKDLKSMSDDTLHIRKFATIQKRNENHKKQQTRAMARERLELRNGLRLINHELKARQVDKHLTRLKPLALDISSDKGLLDRTRASLAAKAPEELVALREVTRHRIEEINQTASPPRVMLQERRQLETGLGLLKDLTGQPSRNGQTSITAALSIQSKPARRKF